MILTILEQKKFESIPPENFDYVDPFSVSVRTANPKWTWVARVCHEIPEGKCVLFPVAEGYEAEHYAKLIRSNLCHSKTTQLQRFSVRRSKDGKSVVVLRQADWATTYRRMESAA